MRKRDRRLSAVSNPSSRSAARAVPCPCASSSSSRRSRRTIFAVRHHQATMLPAVWQAAFIRRQRAKVCILGSAVSLFIGASADWYGGRRRGRFVEFARRAHVAIIGAIWTFVRWRSAKGLSRTIFGGTACRGGAPTASPSSVCRRTAREGKSKPQEARRSIDIPLMGGLIRSTDYGRRRFRRRSSARGLPHFAIIPGKINAHPANDLLTLQPAASPICDAGSPALLAGKRRRRRRAPACRTGARKFNRSPPVRKNRSRAARVGKITKGRGHDSLR